MEPVSILELTVTVLELSWKLYKIFKAIHDAPQEILEYLAVLEAVRRNFQDVQEYAEMHQRSSFFTEDGMCLRIVEPALKDCELEFTLQLSLVESMTSRSMSSFFTKSWDRTKWVLKKETIDGLTKKLEKLQSLLGLAVTTSTGKNEVLMREKLEIVGLEVHQVKSTYEAEAADRRTFLLKLQQYMTELQRGTGTYLQLAQEANIRSDARLGDLADSLATDLKESIDFGLTQQDHESRDSSSVSLEKPMNDSGADALNEDGQIETRQAQGQENRASTQGVLQPGQDETSGQAETLGCQPVIEEAFMRFKTSMSYKDSDTLDIPQNGFDMQNLVSQLSQKSAPLSRRISRITSSLAGFTGPLDTVIQSSPSLTSIIYGSMKVLLSSPEKDMSSLLDGMAEMSDAVTSCEREVVLYKDPRLYGLVENAYFELLQVIASCTKYFQSSSIRRYAKSTLDQDAFQRGFNRSIAEIRRLSQAVQREVDYHHRVEMRETSSRIVDMQLEQRKILATLEDQRRILRSLEEERKVMNVVREQQKILQIVQQIQGAMQAKATQEARA